MWKRNGTQRDEWAHGQFAVSSKTPQTVSVIFEAVRGSSYAGDIALDDIEIKSGDCPATRK